MFDGRSVLLDDGREVRLAAIEVPALPASNETSELGLVAKAGLEAILADQSVELRPIAFSDECREAVVDCLSNHGFTVETSEYKNKSRAQ